MRRVPQGVPDETTQRYPRSVSNTTTTTLCACIALDARVFLTVTVTCIFSFACLQNPRAGAGRHCRFTVNRFVSGSTIRTARSTCARCARTSSAARTPSRSTSCACTPASRPSTSAFRPTLLLRIHGAPLDPDLGLTFGGFCFPPLSVVRDVSFCNLARFVRPIG